MSLEMLGAVKADEFITTEVETPWWKYAIAAVVTVGGLVLVGSVAQEVGVWRNQKKKYDEWPVPGRRWKRTLVTGAVDLFRGVGAGRGKWKPASRFR